ncbi:MAG: hypothetical protein AB7V50_04015 [Vampirovibrionia bacterium]
MKIKLLNIVLLVFLAVIIFQNTSIAQNTGEQKAINIINKMKATYVKSDKALLNVNWLPKSDINCKSNHVYCRSNLGMKVEKIGQLNCVDLKTLKYTINKGATLVHALYSTLTCSFYKLIVETNSGTPKRYYVYNINYPNAVLEKIVLDTPNGPIMSFKANGKLDSYVNDNTTGCLTENSSGKIVESPNSRDLCRKAIMNGIPAKNYRQ